MTTTPPRPYVRPYVRPDLGAEDWDQDPRAPEPAAAPPSYPPISPLPPPPPPSRRDRRRARRAARRSAEPAPGTAAVPAPDGPSPAPRRHGEARADKHRQARRAAARKTTRRAADKEYRPERLALRGVDGYITRTKDAITVWFVEPAAAWSMRTTEVRERKLLHRAQRQVELAEFGPAGVHQRVTHRPWPVGQWAALHDRWARSGVSTPPRDVPGALSWSEYVVGEQSAQLRGAMTSKSVYWGVELSARSVLAQMLEGITPALSWAGPVDRWLGGHLDAVLDREIDDLRQELGELAGIMRAPGIGATPAGADQMEWLLRRSATLGLPGVHPETAPTEHWDMTDLASLVDAAEVTAEPRRDCVQVSGLVAGRRVTRWVSVLTMGRMGELIIPEQNLPWMVWADPTGPVEWSARMNFPPDTVTRRSLERQIRKVASQQDHYTTEHGKDVPPDLEMKAARARQVKDEIEHDHSKLSTRLEGWWRLAVSAGSEEEVLERAEAVKKAYAPQIRLEHLDGQYQQYREFMPGEPLSSTAHRRRMNVRVAAAALPSATDRIGDRHGPQIAETASLSCRPVNWDMWFAMEVGDKSGLTPVVGGLGAGKTHLGGICVYKAVRSGARGIVLDPSGLLARLARLPELAPYTHLVDLMHARPGTLNPYRVIADPQRAHFGPGSRGDEDFEADLRSVRAERKQFVADILRQLLPWQLAQMNDVREALSLACSMVGGGTGNDPGMVLDALKVVCGTYGRGELDELRAARHAAGGSVWPPAEWDKAVVDPAAAASYTAARAEVRAAAASVVRELDDLKDLQEVRLLFPQPGVDPGWPADQDKVRLTILTMPGLQLPQNDAEERNYSLKERLGVPLVHLASWLTHRLIYDTPREIRKIVLLDEARYLSGHGASSTLFVRLERDTRKFNVRALVLSQLAGDFLTMPGYESLTHEVIVGSVQGHQAQLDALRLLKLDDRHGWDQTLNSLNSAGGTIEDTHDPDVRAAQGANDAGPPEYVMKIGDDVELIRVDYARSPHLAHVVAALDSSPTDRSAAAPAGPGEAAA